MLSVLLVFVLISIAGKMPVYAGNDEGGGEKNNINVILITINVLRADHVSCYGYRCKTTPAIDELAEESYVFKNAFAHAGYTLPNMMSILTSTYPDFFWMCRSAGNRPILFITFPTKIG